MYSAPTAAEDVEPGPDVLVGVEPDRGVLSDHDIGRQGEDEGARLVRAVGRVAGDAVADGGRVEPGLRTPVAERAVEGDRAEGLVHVGDGDGERRRGVRARADGGVVDFDGDVERRVGLEVERRAGDQPQLKAARVVEDLEQVRIGARQAQTVHAQTVVGDRDVGDLDRGGRVGVLRQAGQNRSQAHASAPGSRRRVGEARIVLGRKTPLLTSK